MRSVSSESRRTRRERRSQSSSSSILIGSAAWQGTGVLPTCLTRMSTSNFSANGFLTSYFPIESYEPRQEKLDRFDWTFYLFLISFRVRGHTPFENCPRKEPIQAIDAGLPRGNQFRYFGPAMRILQKRYSVPSPDSWLLAQLTKLTVAWFQVVGIGRYGRSPTRAAPDREHIHGSGDALCSLLGCMTLDSPCDVNIDR